MQLLKRTLSTVVMSTVVMSTVVVATVVVATVVVAGWLPEGSAAEELNCLTSEEQADAALYPRLQQRAYAFLDQRDADFELLKTPEQIRDWQDRRREFMIRQLGGFPERTPLNGRTVRIIQADGYRIENVIFESLPHHHITANLYLPDTDGRVPGVAVSSGHSRTAKTADYNQRFGIMMARQGMAALCFDPIGQGERSQILTESGEPRFAGTTTEHFLIGVGSVLVGRNTARYRIWDAMRAIDYLCSRPEVDPERIGFTGCSGGGTLTSYVMALDDRVVCAAPACYLTTFRRLIETIGPQDAEQNIFGQLAFGLEQTDYVLLRAPRPTLISSTTSDFFDIRGSWETFRQSKRVYGRLGFPQRVDLVEVDGQHGVQPQSLATIAHWMQRWLLNRDVDVPTAELQTRPASDLLCTESGQVLTLPGERSVFDLNAAYAAELTEQRRQLWQTSTPDQLRGRIREVLKIRPPSDVEPPTWEDRGRIARTGYHIDRLILTTDRGTLLPALTYHPPAPSDEAWLYLHDEGKAADGAVGGPIETLVQNGSAVVAFDLSGQGETASGTRDALLTDWKTYYLAYLLGDSLTGLRVDDALAAADFVAYYEKDRSSPRKVHLTGVGQSGIVALHAAALNPDLFASVTLRNTPKEWTAPVSSSTPGGLLDSTIHGVLQYWDLPELVQLAGPEKVRFEE